MKSSGKNISLTSYDEIFTPDTAPSGQPYGRIVEIPLEQLHPFKNHPFRVVDDEHMQKTAESIRDYGVLVPGLVRPRPEGEYEIISGHRRKRASEIAGKTTMPVIIRDLNDAEANQIALIENLQRENLNPIEEAQGYQTLMQQFQMTQEEVAKTVGRSRPAVANALRLLNLPGAVQDALEKGKLTVGHAKALAAIRDEGLLLSLAARAADDRITVREIEQIA